MKNCITQPLNPFAISGSHLLLVLATCLVTGCDLDRIEDMGGTTMDPCKNPADFQFQSSLQAGILDSATAIVKSDTNGYFITGYTKKQGDQILLYNTNLCQDNQLYLGLGSSISEYTQSGIAITSASDIIVAGSHQPLFQEPKGYIAKVSTEGVIVDVWNEFFDKGLKLYDLKSTSTNNLLFGGAIVTEGAFGDTDNAFVMLMDEGLGVIRSVHFESGFAGYTYDAVELPGGKIGAVGSRWIGFGYRIFLGVTNSNGDMLLNTTLTYNSIGGDNSVYGTCATATSDGNIVLAGYYSLLFPGGTAAFAMKVTPEGTLIWEKEYTNQVMEIIERHVPASIIETSDGGFAIVGTHKVNNPNPDAFLLKINANGDYDWDRSYGGSAVDYGTDVIQESDNGFVLTGYTKSFNDIGETGRMLFVKTDSDGNVN